jgi:hypothetical protein
MFRWIAIFAAAALAVGAAYGQSSAPQTQPTLPLDQGQMMGHMMNSPMNGGMMPMDPSMMPMMQMMGAGMMGPGMMGPEMMGPGMMGSGMMNQGMMGPTMCRGQMGAMGSASAPASYLEARLAFAKSELAIDGSQEDVWQAYATALRGQVQPTATRMAGMQQAMMGDAAFPARFDARVAMLEDQLSGLKSVREAAVGLYATLNDAQKHNADALLPMSLCM